MLKIFQSSLRSPINAKKFPLKFFSTTSKDYYGILGVPRGATIDEIKEAYRNLAKKYHPDVSSTGVYHEPDGEKFKEVAEAYAVLSVPESKLSYDFLNQNTPESLYREKRNENYRKMTERGPDGQLLRQKYKKGSYAEEKFKMLEEERKRFNVDAFGRYKGGLPVKGKGSRRGNSLGPVGSLHDPLSHNMAINPHPDSQFVTDQDALAFKLYQNEDKYVIQKRWLWFKAEIDYDFFKFNTYRIGWRWFKNLFFLFWGVGAYFIYMRNSNLKMRDQILRLLKEKEIQDHYEINGEKVVVTKNGVLKKE